MVIGLDYRKCASSDFQPRFSNFSWVKLLYYLQFMQEINRQEALTWLLPVWDFPLFLYFFACLFRFMGRKKNPGFISDDQIRHRVSRILKFSQEILTHLQTIQLLLNPKNRETPLDHIFLNLIARLVILEKVQC